MELLTVYLVKTKAVSVRGHNSYCVHDWAESDNGHCGNSFCNLTPGVCGYAALPALLAP
jgi:hypothetical protein